MNPIQYIVSLFYHWFNTKESSKDVAYEISLIAFTILLFCNLLTIFTAINMMDYYGMKNIDVFLKNFIHLNKEQQYLIAGIGLIVGSLLNSVLASRKKIKSINYDLRDETIDFVFLFIYIIGSITLFVIVAKNRG